MIHSCVKVELSYEIKNAPRGAHCGGKEECRCRDPPQAENPASRILFHIRYDKDYEGESGMSVISWHPELKQELWGGHLWNPSYCAVTVSDRSRDQVMAYIEGQKEKEKRK